jgi:hypothetical protein
MNNQYEIVPRRFYQLKAGYSGLPEKVSIYGAPPRPFTAYELVNKGYSIFDKKNNTYSNYFFGKIGIDSEQEAQDIISRLTAK